MDRSEQACSGQSPASIPVPLLNINSENAPLVDEILQRIDAVCRAGQFVLGPEVVQLEKSIAQRCQTNHAVACASGSEALLMALMAFDIGAGDEVIVPSFTFFATASAVWRLGAKPVFADIDPATFNLDPQAVRRAITPKTKAIIPVHLYGQAADMEAISAAAAPHDIAVIEDAAQAIDARRHDRPVGSLGHIGCFSFYPTKNLGGFGDGGMLTTNDDRLAERLRLIRGHGMQPRYYHQVVGINGRLDSFQAAALNVKLEQLERWTTQRQTNAARYRRLFAQQGLDQALALPTAAPGCDHVWNQFTVRVPDGRRDALREHLTAAKVSTEIFYPVPLHLQQCFADLGYQEGSLPETERATREVLCLPIFPSLTEDQQRAVVDGIAGFHCIADQRLASA